jgi:hypothetical protein
LPSVSAWSRLATRSASERAGISAAEVDGRVRNSRVIGYRYGFTWTREILDVAGWADKTALKQIGGDDAVYNKSIQIQRRKQAKEETLSAERERIARQKIRDLVEDIILATSSRNTALASMAMAISDPDDFVVALDHFEQVWPALAAAQYARELLAAGWDGAALDSKLAETYRDKPWLLEHARAAAMFDG